ncbi:LCP family protein [Allorhizocola rhizosphaerae]|uniref:LCP family protein n=1 Tax=Allorhizocola rhizosphaerae TaxID=1872709 RepID=UPI000E3D9482|nr:LCP family protein [Allorhizocola rhizosphaerae]
MQARGARWPKVLLGVGLTLILLAGAGGVALRTLLHRYESNITHEILLDPSARDTRAEQASNFGHPDEPLNFLLIGSDLRPTEPEDGQRSDTIIIAQVNRARDAAHLVSIPRDLLVDIPQFEPTNFYGSREKINAAFHFGGGASGGVQLLSATLAQMTGLRFDGAAVVDFGGFERIIDLLGGVQLCVDTSVDSVHTGRYFEVGCHTFTGEEALDYSRQRYGLENGDYDRQRHNQQLLKAIFATALSRGITTNPLKIDQFIRALGDSLTVDTGGASVADVLLALRKLRPHALTGVTVPSYPQMIGAESFVLMDAEAPELFNALRDAQLEGWVALNPQWVHQL